MKKYRMLLCLTLLMFLFVCSTWAATAGYTKDVNGTVDYNESSGKYTASYTGVTTSKQYTLMVVKSDVDVNQLEANPNAVMYIDQKNAETNTITFEFVPKSVPECKVYLGGEFPDGEESPILLGTLDSQGMTLSGTALSWNNTDNARYLLYDAETDDATIRADVVKDTPELALSYTATKETPVATSVKKQYKQDFSIDSVAAGSYKLAIFKAGKYVPAIVTVDTEQTTELGDIPLRLYGDVNNDGIANAADATQILRYSVKNRNFTDSEVLAGNVNSDKVTDASDATQVLRYAVHNNSTLDRLP